MKERSVIQGDDGGYQQVLQGQVRPFLRALGKVACPGALTVTCICQRVAR